MTNREIKAKSIAISMVAPPENPGICSPSAIAKTAPKDAPLETPRVEPSAKGFRKSPCIAPPQSESAAPERATQSTLGRRTETMMARAAASSDAKPKIAPKTELSASFKGTATLPTQTQSKKIASVARDIIMYATAPKRSFLCAVNKAVECLGGVYKPGPGHGNLIGVGVENRGILDRVQTLPALARQNFGDG